MWLYSFDAGKQIIECLRECQDYLLDLLNKRLLLLNPMKFGPDKGFILRNGPSGLSTKPRLLNLLPKLSRSRGNECVWSWSKEVNKELSNTSSSDQTQICYLPSQPRQTQLCCVYIISFVCFYLSNSKRLHDVCEWVCQI